MLQDRRAMLEKALRTIQQLEAKLERVQRGLAREPIAVIGIGCRLPGGIASAEEYWRLLAEQRVAIRDVPERRFVADDFLHPDPDAPGKMVSTRGGFLDAADEFDASFFGLSPREAMQTDPQHRLALEVGFAALEDAGYAAPAEAVGVYLGITTTDYAQLIAARGPRGVDAFYLTGNSPNFAAGRIAHALGLRGPALAIDAACASSLISVTLACRALQNDECALALAGGVNLMLSPLSTIAVSKARMLSPSGMIRPFEARADGILRGEGCGFVVLKPLAAALRDGDNVRAVLVGAASNHNGGASGITVPSARAQEALLRTALQQANLTPSDIDYVEAHGTGTPLGDPIELDALSRVFSGTPGREEPLVVGAVKANIGHLESAAGIAGLIKAVLALEKGLIPGQPDFERPTNEVDWARLPLRVPRSHASWPCGNRRRYAGVTALGGSGTNAHVILMEAPQRSPEHDVESATSHLLTLSARSEAALREIATSHAAHLDCAEARPSLASVCYTSNVGRRHFPKRLAVRATSLTGLVEQLRAFVAGEPAAGVCSGSVAELPAHEIVFFYTGQGSLHPGVARQLYDRFPLFRDAVLRCTTIARQHSSSDVTELLLSRSAPATQRDTACEQLALFTTEYALTELWRSFGVEPTCVVGHSIGEFAAAHTARVFDLETALALVAERGRLMQSAPAGAMAAVMTNERRVLEWLAPHQGKLEVAAVNGAEHVVISGQAEALEQVLAQARAQGIASMSLDVPWGFHSPLMDAIVEPFHDFATRFSFSEPRTAFVSSVTGALHNGVLNADYWANQLRKAVRFTDALRALPSHPTPIHMEIGPRPVLARLGRKFLGPSDTVWLSVLERTGDDCERLMGSLAELYVRGVPLRFEDIHAGAQRRRAVLPGYPYERNSYWIGRSEREHTLDATFEATHPLIDGQLETALGLVMRSHLSGDRLELVKDHRIRGHVVVPASFWVELTLSAVLSLSGAASCTLSDCAFLRALVLKDSESPAIQVIFQRSTPTAANFQIFSRATPDDAWICHAKGHAEWSNAGSAPEAPLDVRSNLAGASTNAKQALGKRLANHGIELGPRFDWLELVAIRESSAFARLRAPTVEEAWGRFTIHPGLLDSCLQLIAAPGQELDSDQPWVPFHIARVTLSAARTQPQHCQVVLRRHDPQNGVLAGDVRVLGGHGEPFLVIEALSLRPLPSEALDEPARAGAHHVVAWPVQPLPAVAQRQPGLRWLLIGGTDSDALRLARMLEQGGALVHRANAVPDSFSGLEATGVVLLHGIEPRALAELDQVTEELCLRSMRSIQALLAQTTRLGSGLWIATRGAVAIDDAPALVDPAQSALWGLGRVAANEHPGFGVRLVDLDPDEPEPFGALVAELTALDREDQIAIRRGERRVARLRRAAAQGAAEHQSPGNETLSVGSRGDLKTLRFETLGMPKAPGADEVVVEVSATGLNFRDVLNALGMYPGDGPFGGECAGRVHALGSSVTGVELGAEVVVLFPRTGAFDRYVTVQSRFVQARPRNLSDVEAAGLPVPFLTAMYGLERGKLQKGSRVLIHAGAGGVGLAAIQLARKCGAEVFATAHPRKWSYLRALGAVHVGSSRDTEFATTFREKSGGNALDLVLNSLSGEFIPASLSLLRSGGAFVEIGKRGIWSPERVRELRPDVDYSILDLLEIAHERPADVAAALKSLLERHARGDLVPLYCRAFTAKMASSAFEHMAHARHLGRIVVTRSARAGGEAMCRHDAAYLITGGTGALGRAAAGWLAEHGARHVLLISRGGAPEQETEIVSWLAKRGCEARIVRADVARRSDVESVLRAVDERGLRLAGIVHAAGVKHDALLSQQDDAGLEAVLAPKVRGAWNLHCATLERPLDFLVFVSSAAAVLGNPGQAAYAAANAFLGGLAHFRRLHGLKAQVVDFGPLAGIGMNRENDERWTAMGISCMSSTEGLAALGRVLSSAVTQELVLTFDAARLRARQERSRGTFPLLDELCDVGQGRPVGVSEPVVDLNALLSATPRDLRQATLEHYLAEQLAHVLGLTDPRSLDPTRGFAEQGLESLSGLELQNRLQKALGRPLPATIALDHPTLRALAKYLLSLTEEENHADPEPIPERVDVSFPTRLAEQVLGDIEAELAVLGRLTGASRG